MDIRVCIGSELTLVYIVCLGGECDDVGDAIIYMCWLLISMLVLMGVMIWVDGGLWGWACLWLRLMLPNLNAAALAYGECY